MDTIAGWNPVTYLLAGMRALLYEGWEWRTIGGAVLAVSIVGLVSMTLCFAALRARLKRNWQALRHPVANLAAVHLDGFRAGCCVEHVVVVHFEPWVNGPPAIGQRRDRDTDDSEPKPQRPEAMTAFSHVAPGRSRGTSSADGTCPSPGCNAMRTV